MRSFRTLFYAASLAMLVGQIFASAAGAAETNNGVTSMGWPAPLGNEESWRAMPTPVEGGGQPLPTWARMLAREMPKTAAAFLELDYAQRTASPVEPTLRAAMRWVAASDNRCAYAQETAKADALRAGISPEKWQSLATEERTLWSAKEKAALEFAHAMTVDSDGYSDEAFADLVKLFDERQAGSMVLLMAYANFQDRLLICLGVPAEENGPMPPVKVRFSPDSLTKQTTAPSAQTKLPQVTEAPAAGKDVIDDQSTYTWLSYSQLQERLRQQRERKTRLRIPAWDEFADKLPPGLMEKPSDIVWYKLAFGYAHELAVPFEIYLRTAGSEVMANWDRQFGNCLFWMVTAAVKCPYCMGHCEMNFEVSGMDAKEIAAVSEKLAGDDWSSFTAPQQHALAFARKLTKAPWEVERADMDALREGFGPQRAFFIALNASRYNYMTRISNGFQLTLESDNPFWEYYRMKAPEKASEEETQKTSASDQPRPTPVTRTEMKRLLEDMKQRTERIPLPPLADGEQTDADPRAQSYESRLGRLYLPATEGIRSYLNFSGSSPRSRQATSSRPQAEPDPALTLDYGFKTRLFWIASRANNCQYCLGHQESKLLAVGMQEDDIASLDSDWSMFPANEQAAFALARRLTLEPHLLTDADIDRCRAYYNDLQILEMILSVAGNNAINRWKEGVGVPQSRGGGNFGGASGEEHSYLTETSERFQRAKSKVVQQSDEAADALLVPTTMDRTAELMRVSVSEGLRQCAARQARLPLVSNEQAHEVLGELAPAGTVPGWMRLLANFPIAGKRQVAGFVATERELELSPILRAQISWVIARQNGAWYSLAEAQKRLAKVGQSPEQIAALEHFEEEGSVAARDRALLVVAKHLAASPVVVTDAEVAEAVNLAGAKEVVQTVHYAAMRSLFDRFTEAAGLPAD